MISSRRSFITGLGAIFIAAPAIVRVQNIMPVKAIDFDAAFEWSPFYTVYQTDVVRRAFVPRLFVQMWIDEPMLGDSTIAGLDIPKRSE